MWVTGSLPLDGMPNSSLEEAIKEAYACAPAGVSIIHTLEIRQPSVQATYFIARHPIGITATDELGNSHNFLPCGFGFSLPPSNEEGFQSLNLAIDNIDRRVSDFINTAKSSPIPVEVWYRPFLSTDLSKPQMKQPLVLYLKEVQMSNGQVQGRATFMDVVNKKFPLEIYTREVFPALG